MKRGELSKVLPLVWVFIFIVYAAPALAQPWTITVTTNADNNNDPWTDCPPPGNNDCSLREAITVANWNGASGDTIVFDAALDGATITLDPSLGLGGLWIGNDSDTTIDATTLATGITINASGIDFPLSLNSANITIQGPITITNAGTGGAAVVLNPGADNSTLQGITVSNNGGIGISIQNVGGAWLDGVTVANNTTGSGIFLDNVSNVNIGNSTVSYNYDDGIGVRDSNSVSIANSTISSNGQNGLSSGVFIFGASNEILLMNNTIEDNGGNGITIQEDFTNPGVAPNQVDIEINDIHGNGFLAGDGVGIHIAGAVRGSPDLASVVLLSNMIYNNAAQGILIEPAASVIGGPQYVVLLTIEAWPMSFGMTPSSSQYVLPVAEPLWIPPEPPFPPRPTSPNYIYSNGQEGILIKGSGTSNNVVTGSYIGVDPDGNIAPNNNSGIALFGGATDNVIEGNTIAYNRYQNVLISSSGTSNNIVRGNIIQGGTNVSPPVGYDNAGVVINNGATNNTVSENEIAYHVYDGVQVVGPGTDGNQIIGNNRIYANGRGIAVIQDYADATPPDPDAPPFDLQTDSFTAPGPANTLIEGNQIYNNNNDGILVRRDGGGTIIRNNDIIKLTMELGQQETAFVSSAPHPVLRTILSLIMPRTGFTRSSSLGKMTRLPLQTMTCSPSPSSRVTP